MQGRKLGNFEDADGFAVPMEALLRVVVEIWRLGRRVDQSEIADRRVRDGFERVTAALTACGITIEDLEGERYDEGMHMDVIACDGGDAIIQETVRPAILVAGRRVPGMRPQVILGPVKGDKDAKHD